MNELVVPITDCHFGKQTKSFNTEILKQRLDLFSQRLRVRLKVINLEVDRITFVKLGDIMDNDSIYPTQAHHVDDAAAYAREQVRKSIPMFRSFYIPFTDLCPIRIIGVPGNHGRVGKYTHEHNNWDLVFYDALYWSLENNNDIDVESTSSFYRIIETGGLKALLYHGHSIRMYRRIPHYGIRDRIRNWYSSLEDGFDYAMMGHFHTHDMATWNGIPTFLNGTMVTDDMWAKENFGTDGENVWEPLFIMDGQIVLKFPISLKE